MIAILRHFTIRARMLGAIGMVMCLLAGVGDVGLWGLQRVNASSDHFIQVTHESLANMGDLRHALGNLRRYEMDLLLNATDSAKITDDKGKCTAAADDARAQLKERTVTTQGDAAAGVARLPPLLAAYVELTGTAFKQLDGTPDGAIQTIKNINAGRRQVHAVEVETSVLAKALLPEKAAYLAAEAGTVKLV